MSLVDGDRIGHRASEQLVAMDQGGHRDGSRTPCDRRCGEGRPAVGSEQEVHDDGDDGSDERPA